MNYLKYIEHSAENLQFFLWHRDYSRRFSELPQAERGLSPEWTIAQQADAEMLTACEPRKLRLSPDTAALLKGTDFAGQTTVTETEIKGDPLDTPPRTPSSEATRNESPGQVCMVEEGSTLNQRPSKSYTQRGAEAAFEEAGLKWQPCRCPPCQRQMASALLMHSSQSPFNPSGKRLPASSTFILPTVEVVSSTCPDGKELLFCMRWRIPPIHRLFEALWQQSNGHFAVKLTPTSFDGLFAMATALVSSSLVALALGSSSQASSRPLSSPLAASVVLGECCHSRCS